MTETWTPPPDPDFDVLEFKCRDAWHRDSPTVIAFDTETSGFKFDDSAFCVTLAWHGVNGVEGFYIELNTQGRIFLARAILAEATHLIGHNIKFDLIRAMNKGFLDAETLSKAHIHDTEALAHLDDEYRKKGLKELAVTLLNYDDTIEKVYKSGKRVGEKYKVAREKVELEEAKKWAKKKYGYNSVGDFGYDVLPRGVIVPYAIMDAVWTLQLYDLLRPEVEKFDDLWGLYIQEMALTRVFLKMEQRGMAVDVAYVETKRREYARRVLDFDLEIEKLVGKTVRRGKIPRSEREGAFNPSSSAPDVANFLTEAGFPSESYDAKHLRKIDHPLAKVVLEMREADKILTTYLTPIINEEIDGIIHPSIRQHGARTGRVSSGKQTGD